VKAATSSTWPASWLVQRRSKSSRCPLRSAREDIAADSNFISTIRFTNGSVAEIFYTSGRRGGPAEGTF
jgi:hypothetical protein